MLFPSKEKEQKFRQDAGAARYAYNWALETSEVYYSKHKATLQIGEMRKNRQKVLSYHQRRLIKAFPNLQSRYENAYKDFKKTLEKKK